MERHVEMFTFFFYSRAHQTNKSMFFLNEVEICILLNASWGDGIRGQSEWMRLSDGDRDRLDYKRERVSHMKGQKEKREEGKMWLCMNVAQGKSLCVNTVVCMWMYMYGGEDAACFWRCVCVNPRVPPAHTLVPVKSRKLQAISVFKKEKRASASQSVAAYETAAWPDFASLQSLCCCLQHHSGAGLQPGMVIPLSLNGHFI